MVLGTCLWTLAKAGLKPTYHDLKDSKTAGYAQFRFERAGYDIATRFTDSFDPTLGSRLFDGVVALDFLEHVINVPEWVGHIHKALKKGGVFMAQNAFAIGSGPDGSIPMHLQVNDRFEHDWIPLLKDIGFENPNGGDWWVKK
jgi:cyclopropane fatty-acyl-phospholipid synthase-like methyltransferase